MSRRERDESWEAWVARALPGRHLQNPPAGVVRRALALGAAIEARRRSRWSSLVELLFDSASAPLPAGVRGLARGERRLLYRLAAPEGGEMQLDLQLSRDPRGGLAITGQLLPPLAGAVVQARLGAVRRRHTLGEAGEFTIHRLAGRGASLSLEISVAGEPRLVLDDVPLPDPGGEAA